MVNFAITFLLQLSSKALGAPYIVLLYLIFTINLGEIEIEIDLHCPLPFLVQGVGGKVRRQKLACPR